MKTLRLLPVLALFSALTGGCTFGSGKAITLIKDLSHDDASSHIVLNTIYGRIEYTRTNPHTDSLPHTISPDGTVKVDPNPAAATMVDNLRTEQLRHLDNILNPQANPPIPVR